ncbi:ABC transporter permease [Mycoplasmopsis columbinasalis]|nr:ABC transporter permease [Mycoplasmopsis columbinasalis]
MLYFCIFAVAAIAGMFTERAGIVNVAINGMMIFGCLGYTLTGHLLGTDTEKNFGHTLLCTLVGLLLGLLTSLLFGFATIKLKSSQTISGFAFNLLATGVSLFLLVTFGESRKFVLNTPEIGIFVNAQNAEGAEFKFEIITWKLILTLAIIFGGWFLLYKTKWGLRFRSVGENPNASDAAGINVNSYKWQSVLISRGLAALAGTFFGQATTLSTTFDGDVQGIGYLALAIMITGQWNILNIAVFSLFFAAMLGVANISPASKSIAPFSDIVLTLPYFITILVIIFTAKRSKAPAAAGLPYDKSMR